MPAARPIPFRRKAVRRGPRRGGRGLLADNFGLMRLAALGGFFVGLVSVVYPVSSTSGARSVAGSAISQCTAVDGDTLRCGGERIRLLGIDSPEMPGHCRPGRDCVAGDPFAARASLQRAMGGTLTIERVGEDHYGRTLALVSGPGGDLSCHQLHSGHADYKPRWDDGGRLSARCH